jgi:hypothetical protein
VNDSSGEKFMTLNAMRNMFREQIDFDTPSACSGAVHFVENQGENIMAEILSKSEIVEKGDWIKLNPDSKQNVTIKWQQDLSSKQEEYLVLPYSVKNKQASGSLFIQLGYADLFFGKCQKDESSNPLVSGGYKI